MLDFRELGVNGDDFELLVRELLYNKGLEVYWSGKGQDGGKDLLCIEKQSSNFKPSEKRWLIQCKHNAHSGKSVGKNDLDSIVDSCSEHNASGYLLVCSTYPSSSVVRRLEEIQNNKKITTCFWDYRFLERELLNPENWSLINRFMPKSAMDYGWRISTIEPDFWHASYKGNIFYISTRMGANYDLYLKDIADRVEDISNKKIPEGHIIRLRAVYFDEKHSSYRLYIDYLIPIGESEDENNLGNTVKEATHGRVIDGIWYDIDLMTYRYSPYSDHFDRDHQDYYNTFINLFKYGFSREGERDYIFSKKDNSYEVTQDLVEGSYNQLIDTLKKIDFIKILNCKNARIEFLNQFSDNFTWDSTIESTNFSIDNFFDVKIRFECDDFDRLIELVESIPLSVTSNYNLDKNYIITPNAGFEEDENIYTINIKVHPAMIKSKLQFRKHLNQYLLEIKDSLELYLQKKN